MTDASSDDGAIFDFGSEENKKAVAEGLNAFVVPEGKYHLQVVGSKVEDNSKKDGKNWVMDFAVLEPGFETAKIRHWHVLKASNLWKTIPALEAIFQEPWEERKILPDDIKNAYGMKVIGIITIEPHYIPTEAAKGRLINKINDFIADDGELAGVDSVNLSSPGEVGHPDYKPL